MKAPRATAWLASIFVFAGGAWFAYARLNRAGIDSGLPTALARKGEFLVTVTCRGELVAGRSVSVIAPNVPNLQIIWQAAPGAPIKEGDPMIRFDSAAAKRQLQEKEAALNQAQASLDQAVSQAKITEEQDKLELATMRNTAEKARLEVSKAEVLSAMQAEEAKIEHTLLLQKLKVQQATLDLNRASGQSKVASMQAIRDRNQADVELTASRIAQTELKAPSSGIANYLLNYSQGWMNARPFKAGDNVWPGSTVAEIPDLATLRMKAKVEEVERGLIRSGQLTRIHLDPFPEKPFPGKLELVSTLTETSFEWPPTRSFRAFSTFDAIDTRLRPGMNGRLDIVTSKIPDAIVIPAKAVFARQGKPVVLVVRENGLAPAFIEIVARNTDEIAVTGIEPGAKISLVDLSSTGGGGTKK